MLSVCERGIDTRSSVIMFEYLSEDAQQKALAHMQVNSPYDMHWDVIPIAQLPYGSIAEFDQDDIDLQALTQIGYYRL